MSNAKWAIGTYLERDGNEIAEVTNMGAPETTLETMDVTHLRSTDDRREFIGTLFDSGEMTLEGNFVGSDTNGQMGLMADQAAKTVQSFVLYFPEGTTISFSALVTKFKIEGATIDDKIKFSATLKITGDVITATSDATGPSALVITGNVTGPLTLTPVYDDAVFEYIADGSGDATVTVTVTAAGADGITVNGGTVATGVPSSAITLTPDDITEIEVVVSEDDKTSLTYTVRIIGPAS